MKDYGKIERKVYRADICNYVLVLASENWTRWRMDGQEYETIQKTETNEIESI